MKERLGMKDGNCRKEQGTFTQEHFSEGKVEEGKVEEGMGRQGQAQRNDEGYTRKAQERQRVEKIRRYDDKGCWHCSYTTCS